MHPGEACFDFNFQLGCSKIGFCYKIVVVRVRYQSVFRVLSQVLSVTMVSTQIIKVAKEREIYAPPTALCVKIFGWNALKREMEIPVFRT